MSKPTHRVSLNYIRHALLAYQALARRMGDEKALSSAQAGLDELAYVERVVADAAMQIESAGRDEP